MPDREKIALFDFCETLVTFQTADAFVSFVRNGSGSIRMRMQNILLHLLVKVRVIGAVNAAAGIVSLNKKMIARQLKGFSEEILKEYARDYYFKLVRTNLIPETVSTLKRLQLAGYRIIILSAGYDLYLQYFCKEFGIHEQDLICTRIQFENGKCTGRFAGEDCIDEYKVKYLEERINKTDVSSVAFSDSKSDLPMLMWSDKAFVVLKSGSEDWAGEYGYEKIVWN